MINPIARIIGSRKKKHFAVIGHRIIVYCAVVVASLKVDVHPNPLGGYLAARLVLLELKDSILRRSQE
jgi:hypothetical protein